MDVKYYETINRNKKIVQRAEFNGAIFKKHHNYYIAMDDSIYKIRKRLHIAIYEYYHNCSILIGNDVHHIDENPLNNNISNLELLTHAEHTSLNFLNKHKSENQKLKMSESQTGNKNHMWIEPTEEMIEHVKLYKSPKKFKHDFGLSIYYKIKSRLVD